MAAAYAFHIAKNHPFVDGNKRAALMCAGAFLRMNGWDLASEGTQAADAVLGLVGGKIDKQGFAVWLRERCRPRPSLELRDFFQALTSEKLERFFRSAYPGRQPEVAQTAREACQSIPLLEETFLSIESMIAAGAEQKHIDLMKGQLTLLAAIYRLAEDMGYDW